MSAIYYYLTANRLRHASGPVHTIQPLHILTAREQSEREKVCSCVLYL